MSILNYPYSNLFYTVPGNPVAVACDRINITMVGNLFETYGNQIEQIDGGPSNSIDHQAKKRMEAIFESTSVFYNYYNEP